MLTPYSNFCKLISERGEVVAGHVSKGDLYCASPNAEELTEAINGTIDTPVGCTIPESFNALKLLPISYKCSINYVFILVTL